MNWKIGAGCALVIVALVAGYVSLEPNAGAGHGVRPAAPRPPASAPHARAPLPTGPFDLVRWQLEQRAAAGDAEAAYRLGSVIAECRRYVPMADGAFAAMLVRASDVLGQLFGSDGSGAVAADALIEAKARMDEDCEGTDAMRRTAGAADAERWIAQAAELGYTAAMARYGDVAFEEFRTKAELLEHAATVAARRDRARAWLQQAYGKGDNEALFGLAKAYRRGDLYPRDAERALGWWLAYRGAPGPHALGEANGAALDRAFAAGLDPRARERAATFARGVMQHRRVAP